MALDGLLDQLTESRLLNVEADELTGEQAYELAHDYLVNEIQLSPEMQAQKAAQELLARELVDWEKFDALMSPQALRVINIHKSTLSFDKDSHELILNSAFESNTDLAQWLEEIAPDLARQMLLEKLNRKESELRARAAQYLTNYYDKDIGAQLQQLGQQDTEKEVRQAALTTLGQHRPEIVRQILLADLNHPKPDRRIEAIQTLQNYLDTEVVERFFSQLAVEENKTVWTALLQALATPQAEPFRDRWQPLSQTGFWRSAELYESLRELEINLPLETKLRLAPANLTYYLRQEAHTRPLWLIFRAALIVLIYFGLAWWQGWWPFIRWEALPGVPNESLSAIDVVNDDSPTIYVGSYNYGVARLNPEAGWSGWFDQGLPTGTSSKLTDPGANIKGIEAISAVPTKPDQIYVYIYEAGLFVSKDGGESWSRIENEIIPTKLRRPTLDVWEETILLGGYSGFYGSNDSGQSWRELAGKNGLENSDFRIVRFNSEGVPYLGTGNGLYLGQGSFPWRWEKIPDVPPVEYLDFGPDSLIYLALGNIIPDNVACYTPDTGLGEIANFGSNFITALVAHPYDPNIFYISVLDDQIYEMKCNLDQRALGQISGIVDNAATGLAFLLNGTDDYLLIQTNSGGLYQRRP
jgi:hypothetical protein